MHSFVSYDQNPQFETQLSSYLSITCCAIQIIVKAFLSNTKLHYAYYATYAILLISCLLTAILCEKISLIFVLLILIAITYDEYHILCIGLLSITIIFNILFNRYLHTHEYDILKLIDLEDIALDIMPRLYIAAVIFTSISIFIDSYMKNSLHIAIIKFIVFTLIISYFVFIIETQRIKTIFPSYTTAFAFALIISTFIYLDIRYTPSYNKDLSKDQISNDEIIAISFYTRISDKFSKIQINQSKSAQDIIKILEFFQEREIYVSTQTDKKESKVAFFPHITLENLDKIIEYFKRNPQVSSITMINLNKLRESYRRNFIRLAYDQFEQYSYKLYKTLISIELDSKGILNAIVIFLLVICICIPIMMIFGLIASIFVLLILIHTTYVCNVKHKFFKDDMKKLSTEKLGDNLQDLLSK